MFKNGEEEQEEVKRRGPKNLLQELPNPFSEQQSILAFIIGSQ
jgi:hypothetical protein